jgi:hypothetical protein
LSKKSKILPYEPRVKAKTLDQALDTIENTQVLELHNSLEDYENFSLDKDTYITTLKTKLLKKTKRRDPLQIIMSEKLAGIVFHLDYLDRKYPNSMVVSGVSPKANKFVIELEYIKTLLLHQLSFLASALAITDEEINEVLVFQRNGPSTNVSSVNPGKNTQDKKTAGTQKDKRKSIDHTRIQDPRCVLKGPYKKRK